MRTSVRLTGGERGLLIDLRDDEGGERLRELGSVVREVPRVGARELIDENEVRLVESVDIDVVVPSLCGGRGGEGGRKTVN